LQAQHKQPALTCLSTTLTLSHAEKRVFTTLKVAFNNIESALNQPQTQPKTDANTKTQPKTQTEKHATKTKNFPTPILIDPSPHNNEHHADTSSHNPR